MTATARQQELLARFEQLLPSQQQEVIDFASFLAAKKLSEVPAGTRMLQYAGILSDEDAQQMLTAIEEGCEQIDEAGWK